MPKEDALHRGPHRSTRSGENPGHLRGFSHGFGQQASISSSRPLDVAGQELPRRSKPDRGVRRESGELKGEGEAKTIENAACHLSGGSDRFNRSAQRRARDSARSTGIGFCREDRDAGSGR